jgi:amino acid transporter
MVTTTRDSATSTGPGNGIKLNRALSLWNLIIIGMVIIQPTAPMGIYGVISNKAHGHVVTTILLAMVAMLLTAISYGKMAAAYPSAGSAYTYVGQEMHPALGYITGWTMVMDYVLNPLICVAFCAKASMSILPGLSFYAWIVIFTLFFTWVNLRGIKTSARINETLCLGMMIVVAIFLIAVVRFVWNLHTYGPGYFSQPFYNPATFTYPRLFAGTSVAVLTYIGFDGISTLSEEVENPRRNILLATVLVCLITGLLSGIEVYAAQLVWGANPFPSGQVESAFAMVSQAVGGAALFQLVDVTLLIACAGTFLAAQLAAGRLLYGMGRGNALPKSFFGVLDPKTRTPRNSILAVGAFACLGACLLEYFSKQLGGGAYEIGAQAVNFGAFIAFIGVNAAALIRYWFHAEKRTLLNFILPSGGILICAFIWLNLSRTALLLGSVWMAAGILFGAIKTKGFRTSLVSFDMPSEE